MPVCTKDETGDLTNIADRWLDVAAVHVSADGAAAFRGWAWSIACCRFTAAMRGKREAKLTFDVGQGTQDLGFRSEIDILFTADKAIDYTLHVFDENGKPTIAAVSSFAMRQGASILRRPGGLRPDSRVSLRRSAHRSDGETVKLPPGDV